ncbi:MAG: Rrf2 family transcriptional regulator [Burkholderiales bacterium]
MRLTTFTDYSLRVLIYVAARPGTRATIGEIATSFGISEHHLTKVVHSLGKSGFLVNLRGRGGGLTLARPPAEINIGAVVRDTEGAAQPAECFAPDSQCTITRVCKLRGVLNEAVDAFYGILDRYTLEDLVRNRAPLSRVMYAGMPAPRHG